MEMIDPRGANRLMEFFPVKYPALNAGCGNTVLPNWLNADIEPQDPRVYLFDLTKKWLFDDSFFRSVLLNHVLEHLPPWTLFNVFSELARCMKVGGRAYIGVPHSENSRAVNLHFDHVRGFNEDTFHKLGERLPLLVVKTLRLRRFRLGKFFDSWYHPEKWGMKRPNFGRTWYLVVILERV